MTSSTKSGIVEHVKRAQEEATAIFHRQQATIPHSVLAMRGETLPTMRARAAIRATLEYARERAKFNDPAVDAILNADLDIYWGYYAKGPGGPDDVARVFIDALLLEIDQEGGKE